jgi:hypothetical protein
MEKEATTLHLEVAALCLKIRANRIKEEEAMVDCQEEEEVAGDRIHSQCRCSDCQCPLRMVV